MSRFVMSKTPWERCPYPGLKAALEKTDYNQTTLAEATGISATNVSRYVKGDVDVTVRAFLALEDLTGQTFRELWSVAWRVHDAQHWGVPQRRRRISIVADFGGDTAGEILFERKSVSGHPAESGTAGERLTGNAESGASYAVRIRGGL